MTERISKVFGTGIMMSIIILFDATASGQVHHNNTRSGDLTYRSGVSLEWALPGVVVGIVVPFSVSIGNAFELLITDIVICVGVWSWSVDTLLTRDSIRWSVDADSRGSCDESNENEFHFC